MQAWFTGKLKRLPQNFLIIYACKVKDDQAPWKLNNVTARKEANANAVVRGRIRDNGFDGSRLRALKILEVTSYGFRYGFGVFVAVWFACIFLRSWFELHNDNTDKNFFLVVAWRAQRHFFYFLKLAEKTFNHRFQVGNIFWGLSIGVINLIAFVANIVVAAQKI